MSCLQTNNTRKQNQENKKLCRGEIQMCESGIQLNDYIENGNGSQSDLGQSVFQGYKRQVQGSNGLNPAQFCRPWGSTQIFPSRHNEAQRFRQDGRAVVKAWGIVDIPRVDPREGRIRLPSEKGLQPNAALHNNTTLKKNSCKKCVDKEALPQAWERKRKKTTSITNKVAARERSIKVECRVVSPPPS